MGHPASDAMETAPEYERVEIAANGFIFDALAAGPATGELVLLLHGFPETNYEWRHALVQLGAAGYRAVAPNQRGYAPGARPTGVESYALRNMVLDTLGMATALGAERFHVVGHDWGAAVAWVLSSVAKERVLTLTAVSTAHPEAVSRARADPMSCQACATSIWAERKRPDAARLLLADAATGLRREYGDLPEDAIAAYLAALGSEPALDAALSWYRANIDPAEPRPALAPIVVPTLYVMGDRDPTNCVDTEAAHHSLVTGPYRFELLEGVDHWLPERVPEVFASLLVAHLATAEAAPSGGPAPTP